MFKLSKAVRFKRFHYYVVALIAGLTVAAAPLASADSFDNQINALNQANSGSRTAVSNLQSQEATLAGQVAALQARIAELQQQIAANTAKRAQLAQQILQAQADLDKERKTLGENIKAMYMDSSDSTLIMLASSEDLSTFFDKAQHRVAVRNKVTESLEKIKALKAQLEKEKLTVEKMLQDQQAMQGQLGAQQAEVSRLIGLNQSQQSAYQSDISANNARIAELRRLQAVENAKNFVGSVTVGGTGGYPYYNAPWPNSISDPWGMYKRQCVSYTAWKVASSGRYMPFWGGIGNANQWDDNARRAGIPTDYSPRAGDVAISNAGTYGHAMYVESVNANGTINISQYNAGWDGKYSTGTRTTAGLVFIHFK